MRLHEAPLAGTALPESIVHYVVRTQESVILDDASVRNPFSADTYIAQRHIRSILCLPLVNQAILIGVLYLENTLIAHAFNPRRIALLKVLAAQAAISLENTRLYRDLAQREAKIRRLVDATLWRSSSGISKVRLSRPTKHFSECWDTATKILPPVTYAGRT